MNSTYYKKQIATVIGQLTLIGSEKGLYTILWEGDKLDRVKILGEIEINENLDLFSQTEEQLNEYFAGKRKQFNIPLNLDQGTPFQKSVWKALTDIPYGQVKTYGQQAQVINNPKAVRAVGSANGKNPFPIIVPCHRVIASGGKLGGFGGGLHVKQYLLDLEAKYI